MELVLCALIICVFVAYIFRLCRKAARPAFATKGILTGEKLGYMLSVLAFGSKRVRKGNGIDIHAIRKRLWSAYRKIELLHAQNKTLQVFEQTYYDNFFRVEETLEQIALHKKVLRALPHVNGVPRLYAFCELLVKSAGGVVSEDNVRSAVQTYSSETPLSYGEILALDDMLNVALCEYLAVYAHKIKRTRELFDKGAEDAAASRSDYRLLRYDSYVFGRYGEEETSCLNAEIAGEDIRRRRENYVLAVADYNAHIAAAVDSLHRKKSFMNETFRQTLSSVYPILREGDPTFGMLSESTVSMYLYAIYRMAEKKHAPEKRIATEILYKAKRHQKDIAEYILPHKAGKRTQILLGVTEIALLTVTAIICGFFAPGLGWLYVLLGLPILWFGIDFMKRLLARCIVKRRHLPAYAPTYLDKEKNLTTILFPCFIACGGDIETAFRHLQTIASANSEEVFSYCLLLDYPRNDKQVSEGDVGLHEKVKSEYLRLGLCKSRVSVLVRQRKSVRGEAFYQGYEKKRGAIMDFNTYLESGAGDFSLMLGRPERKSKYVITLDSDTLTYDCMQLLCTKAHPYCADVAVLSMQCAPLGKHTPYARLFAGESGPGRYRYASENLSHNLFAVGNYTGKGIYDVSLFRSKLEGVLPDNRILSHDYIEGAIAGCMDSSACAGEDFPQTFDDDFTRRLRWLRGDWQLLPYLFPYVGNRDGIRITNPVPVTAVFSLLSNLILSLVAIAQMSVLILAFFTGFDVFVFLLLFLPQIFRAVFSLRALYRYPGQTAMEWGRCLFDFALLPTIALYELSAIAVTFWRLVTRRKLLEWRVFAHTKGKISKLPNIIVGAVMMIATSVFGLHIAFYGIASVFLLGTFLPAAISCAKPVAEHSDALAAVLGETAQKTFAYFAAQEGLCRLPCDCYQTDNLKGWCARTSPTNIGMALVAYAAAYEMGIIEKDRLWSYADRIITAVEACEKYHGNLYNWYDCQTLAVLPHRFVSTVDSGNFLTALSLLTTYVEGELKTRIETLIRQTDLRVLFDEKRKLFHIGYDDELKACTYNHYDLFGSESTLTYLVACGYGKIPKDAFYALNRDAVRYGLHNTVYSWTGGMFEYLMTRIFIAPDTETLLGQAMSGAAAAHVRYAKHNNSTVWGISECRYNAFDDGGGNLYRAFGVPCIAHAHVETNAPYAPYAAFLALPYVNEKEFIRNINAFVALGVYGDWGYYEALDGSIPVRSYMTHHQGMILAACANACKHNCLVERLQTLPQWRTALLLCGEERSVNARRKKKPYRPVPQSVKQNTSVFLCKCAKLSVIATENNIEVRYAGQSILRNFGLYAENDGKIDLMGGSFRASERAVWHTKKENFICDVELCVLPTPLSVAIKVKYRNTSPTATRMRFYSYAEPVLARKEDFDAHPAYSKMFVETGSEQNGKYMWARRKKSSCTVLHYINTSGNVTYNGDKCAFYERGRGISFGQNLNPVLSGSFDSAVSVGETCEFTAYFLVADSVEQADYAVKLASSPDCLARTLGACAQLVRAVPPLAYTEAENLIRHAYNAVKADGIPMNRPAVAREITAANIEALPTVLGAYYFLYTLGFDFHLVLFCRKQPNEYPSCYFDAQHAVDASGICCVAGNGNTVAVLNVSDASLYNRLKKHTALKVKPNRVIFENGKLIPYTLREQKSGEEVLRQSQEEGTEEERIPIETPLGLGGFGKDGSYVIPLTQNNTPAPWCNILSDGTMGTVLSESGSGYTFGENARQQKLTEWCNDPVTESVSELVAVSDESSIWSVTKKPLTANGAYTVLHARGHSEFICSYHGLTARMQVFLAHGEQRKIYRISLSNQTDRQRAVHAIFAVRPVLGDFRENTLASLEHTAMDCGLALRCGYTGEEAYIYADRTVTCIGADLADNRLVLYDTILKQEHYWGITAALTIDPKETQTLCFSLSRTRPEPFEDAVNMLTRADAFYEKLCKVTFDGEYGYLSQWLPYQVYNSRFMARTGFYQVSGAYGFRDQLQDCLALLYCNPALVREHILECARHQFKEGDVQHWWHSPAMGVRTHICDDRLWLVYAACEYVVFTGDTEIWQESIPYLSDVPISVTDASVYTAAQPSAYKATLLSHCLAAIRMSLDFGSDGLVLMRGGDWNDAMDKVGEKGVGTSVWCSMFLYRVIDVFLPYVKDIDTCDELQRIRKSIHAAVSNAYKSDRFLRARCDDGTVLGVPESYACKIDLLTQSWSVLSGIGSAEQKRAALETAYVLLCDVQNRIVRLFDPPFYSSEGVGYIGDYPPYVRENGGQYTQAAIWYVCALFADGQTERANKLLRWLNPANHSRTFAETHIYCVEPYVMAADIYGGELAGKGGWTWYTGSAAWMYKCLTEYYAGIKIRGNVVSFQPNLPQDTKELNVRILHEGEEIRVKIINSAGKGQWRVRIGEVVYNTSALKLTKGLSQKKIAVIRLM